MKKIRLLFLIVALCGMHQTYAITPFEGTIGATALLSIGAHAYSSYYFATDQVKNKQLGLALARSTISFGGSMGACFLIDKYYCLQEMDAKQAFVRASIFCIMATLIAETNRIIERSVIGTKE